MNARTLAQMHRRPSAYEIVARHEDGRVVALGFSERTTRSVLINTVQANGPVILDLLGDWDGPWTYTKTAGLTFGPVRVCFGRTEREIAGNANPSPS